MGAGIVVRDFGLLQPGRTVRVMMVAVLMVCVRVAVAVRVCRRSMVSLQCVGPIGVVETTAPMHMEFGPVKVGDGQPKRHGDVDAKGEKCQDIANHVSVVVGNESFKANRLLVRCLFGGALGRRVPHALQRIHVEAQMGVFILIVVF